MGWNRLRFHNDRKFAYFLWLPLQMRVLFLTRCSVPCSPVFLTGTPRAGPEVPRAQWREAGILASEPERSRKKTERDCHGLKCSPQFTC